MRAICLVTRAAIVPAERKREKAQQRAAERFCATRACWRAQRATPATRIARRYSDVCRFAAMFSCRCLCHYARQHAGGACAAAQALWWRCRVSEKSYVTAGVEHSGGGAFMRAMRAGARTRSDIFPFATINRRKVNCQQRTRTGRLGTPEHHARPRSVTRVTRRGLLKAGLWR